MVNSKRNIQGDNKDNNEDGNRRGDNKDDNKRNSILLFNLIK